MPEGALDLSRGCGNPTGFARLQPGEVVVDFGCGGGLDVILAAHKVGPHGKVVGLDIAPEMIERAKQAVAAAGLEDRDIDLRVAELEKSQLPDTFADVIISNCVINLCPDKDAVYKRPIACCDPAGGWPSPILSSPKLSSLTSRSAFALPGRDVWEGPYQRWITGRR